MNYAKWLAKHQSSFRLFRDTSKIQGLSYVGSLRGLNSVQFFDLSPQGPNGTPQPIRDFGFTAAMNSHVMRQKEHRH